ncbi:low temperature requirement protein A [Photobacterium ganghwense]|uniref:low temperature requirement protein A n=1 Tax=Photobacterium ganghwense TaxID=320778 RepID=UPI001C2D8F90|nr:low temperature requirement protein A [Photobacterium ganghwense]MBV1843104.1 low temperature requirement protein A [Photobacterium ganghwense]
MQKQEDYEIAPLELFFDLIFVFALIQLSHHLAEHLSWRGFAETATLLVAVLSVWSYTSWAATMIPVSRATCTMMLLLVTMLGLIMNAAIGSAFSVAPWSFVLPMLCIQIGRTIWTIINAPTKDYKRHFKALLIWLLFASPLWILGAQADSDTRLFWWGAAVLIDLLGSYLAHPIPGYRLNFEQLPFDAEHMLERYNLFIIIALGETILMTGASIAKASTDLMTIFTGSCALLITISLWALAFGSIQKHAEAHAIVTINPVRISHYAMNIMTIMVACLIVLAVGNENVVHHPVGHAALSTGLMISLGPGVFLLMQGLFLKSMLNIKSKLHWLGGILTGLSGLLILILSPYFVIFIIGLVLACFAILDWHNRHKSME